MQAEYRFEQDDIVGAAKELVLAATAIDGSPSGPYAVAIAPFIESCASGLEAVLDGYRGLVGQPDALAARLHFVAVEEACGAGILTEMAGYAPPELHAAVLAHAEDEKRHMRMLLNSARRLAVSFPVAETVVVDGKEELAGAEGAFDSFFVSVHLSEIRGAMSFVALRSLIGQGRHPGERYASQVLEAIIKDELDHVAYTGRAVRKAAHTNAITTAEISSYGTHVDRFWKNDAAHLAECLVSPAKVIMHERFGSPSRN